MQTIKKSWLITLFMLLLLIVTPVAMVAAEDAVEDGHSAETTHEEAADGHGEAADHSAEEPIVAQFANADAGSAGTWVVVSLLGLILILLGVVAVIGAVSLGIIGLGYVSVAESDG